MPAVYSTRRAEPGQAAWLQRLLGPLRKSLNLQLLPPLEVRPTGRWGGWCSDIGGAPDGRVAMSSKISFWNDEQLTEVYLHECAHRLLQGQDVDSHGPEFLCTNTILLMRAAPSFRLDSVVSKLSFYDCQDQPAALLFEPAWRAIVIDWAFAVAAELAPTDLPAEDLAGVVCARWLVHIEELEKARQQAAQQVLQAAQAAAKLVAQLIALRSSRSLFAWLGCVGWLALIGVSVVFFNL
jgi:hypothetical protein